jgi:[ribosomal protein S5]-alanine N-acetyltransferase
MTPDELFRTTRLSLRRVTLADAEAIFATYAQDLDVTRYVVWQPHRHVGETREFLQRCVGGWKDGSEFTWAICLPDNTLIGTMALRIDGFKAQAGYGLARPFWGQGYATEALQAIVDWGMQQAAIYRFWAVCDCENPASARVMEKVGMTREGILRRWLIHPQVSGTPRDCLCYSIVKGGQTTSG